jgi:hypothetical protein
MKLVRAPYQRRVLILRVTLLLLTIAASFLGLLIHSVAIVILGSIGILLQSLVVAMVWRGRERRPE